MRVPGNWIMDSLMGITRFPGSPGLVVPSDLVQIIHVSKKEHNNTAIKDQKSLAVTVS